MTSSTTSKKITSSNPTTSVVLRYAHIAPRKARMIARLINGLPAHRAQAQLFVLPHRGARLVEQLLRSGVANAKNRGMNLDDLFVKSAVVDKGPMMKRWMPRAMGRATPIHKVMSHITIVLEERAGKGKGTPFIITTAKTKKKEHAKDKEKSRAVNRKTRGTGSAKSLARENSENETKEKERETKEELRATAQSREKGFTKKMFRRKSV